MANLSVLSYLASILLFENAHNASLAEYFIDATF